MHALFLDGKAWQIFDADPRLGVGFDVRDVSGVDGFTVGWVALEDGGYAAPTVNSLGDPADAATLRAFAATARVGVETAGIEIGGISVATDIDSQNRVANAFTYLQASGAASVAFKAASGWCTLTAEQVRAIAMAVGQHVQACFAAEQQVDAGIASGAITTRAAVEAAFVARIPSG